MIYSLSHVSISYKDLNKVEHFYIKILGLKKIHEFKNKNITYGIFLYAGNNTFLEFFYSKKKVINKNSNLRHICFTTKNILKIKKKLSKFFKGIKIIRGKTDCVAQFFVKDFISVDILRNKFNNWFRILITSKCHCI